MENQFVALIGEMGRNLRNLLPIVALVVIFQTLVVREPMAELELRILGAVLALVGMTFFIRGLEMSIFPLGDTMADGLARRGSVLLLVAFGFAIGFGSTVAEPALITVTDQAAAAAVAGSAPATSDEIARSSLLLRYTVALGVGAAVAGGVLRIVKGWPVIWFVLPGYALVTVMALVARSPESAVAFDAGTAATSAINIPLMLTLGVGLSALIRDRNPLVDGFGLVALASLTPMLVIMLVSAVA
jgi:hypothetical protein